jgi:large subunit ribosomal protein L9
MKVLLIEDIYNLGRAGDVKKVANGYGRNYLIPQGLAVLATPAALKDVETIRQEAGKRRAVLNEEMSGVAESMNGLQLFFAARAGETGKLYGSVTTMMVADELSNKLNVEIGKRQIHTQPLRMLGMHKVNVRLTMDLIPEIDVVIYREGESPENYMVAAEELAAELGEEVEEEVMEEEAEEEKAPEEAKAEDAE